MNAWNREQRAASAKAGVHLSAAEWHTIDEWLSQDQKLRHYQWFVEILRGHGMAWSAGPESIDNWTVLGGFGWAPHSGAKAVSGIQDNAVALAWSETSVDPIYLPWSGIDELEISGPGTVTSGGGFIGGGFGLEGAIAGILTAEVLNALTTTVETVTLLYLSGHGGGVALHTDQYQPESLRVRLGSGFAELASRRNVKPDSKDPIDRLERLAEAKGKGLLNEAEYQLARRKIISELTGE